MSLVIKFKVYISKFSHKLNKILRKRQKFATSVFKKPKFAAPLKLIGIFFIIKKVEICPSSLWTKKNEKRQKSSKREKFKFGRKDLEKVGVNFWVSLQRKSFSWLAQFFNSQLFLRVAKKSPKSGLFSTQN